MPKKNNSNSTSVENVAQYDEIEDEKDSEIDKFFENVSLNDTLLEDDGDNIKDGGDEEVTEEQVRYRRASRNAVERLAR